MPQFPASSREDRRSRNSRTPQSSIPPMSRETRLNLIILAVGLFGLVTAVTLKAVFAVSEKDKYLTSVAQRSGFLENTLPVLAWPAILFFVIISVYACIELFKRYREINDPNNYGRGRRNRS